MRRDFPMFFRRNGTPYPGNLHDQALAWDKDLGDVEMRRVQRDVLENGVMVSTVWLGLDHSYTPGGRPKIFESMVFYKSYDELDMYRYTTEEEARLGHKMLVKKWSAYKTADEILGEKKNLEND